MKKLMQNELQIIPENSFRLKDVVSENIAQIDRKINGKIVNIDQMESKRISGAFSARLQPIPDNWNFTLEEFFGEFSKKLTKFN